MLGKLSIVGAVAATLMIPASAVRPTIRGPLHPRPSHPRRCRRRRRPSHRPAISRRHLVRQRVGASGAVDGMRMA